MFIQEKINSELNQIAQMKILHINYSDIVGGAAIA
jgi:hypothetical protein